MVAILYPRRLRELLDVDQPGGTGLPDQGVPVLHSSNSSFVIQTIAGGGGGSFSLGASNLGNTLGQTGVTGSRVVLAGIGNLTLSQLTDGNGGTISISAGTAGAGFSAGVSGGNTAGDTGATGTRLVLAGGNNITLSQATDANGGTITVSGAATAAQTVQTQNRFNLTLSGNTAGVLAEVSSGTLTLAGGNNITLSQNGNAITISGAAAGGVQTAISGVAASNTTYTSGTVTITGVGGGVTVSSNTGQRIDISVAAPVAQTGTQFSAGISGGNTSGHSGTVAGRVVFAGSNGITLSGSTNGASETITISGITQSTQPGIQHLVVSNTTFSSGTVSLSGFGDITVNTAANIIRISGPVQTAQTGISGVANSQTTYTSGTVSLSELGAITIRSTTGNQFQLSVNSQTVQTQNMVAVTLSGNTSGAQALISSGTMTLAGGNNITVSQAGNAVTISGPNVGGAQTGISGLANSETTYTSGSVTFSALGAITIRSTTGQHFQFSVNSQTVQTQSLFSAGVSTGGNTAGDTGVTGTRLVFVGTNNITLSQATAAAGGTVTISGPTTAAQTNQAGSAYAVGNTYSSSSGTYDARTLSIRGDGIISVAATNSGWRISASQSVQAETQTFVGGIAASNTTYTSGTITITGVGGGVTVSSNTGQRVDISVAAPVAQSTQPGIQHLVVSNTTFSSGTVSLSGFGDITVNTAANLIRISGPVQTAQTGISGIANSQTTYTSGTVSMSELGAITIRSTTGNQFQFSVNSQTLQTSNVHNVTLSGNTAGAMAQISSGTMTLAGGNNITLSQAGNAVTISGGAGGGFSAGVSNVGNTGGATGVTGTRLVFVGSNNVTLSQTTDANGGTVSLFGQAPAGGAFSGGASNLGNTAGATGITGTQLVLVGTNAISLSQTTGANGGTLSIDAPATSSLVGTSGISVSTNGSTISIMQTTGSAFLTSLAPYDESPMVTGQQGQGTLHFAPVRVPEGVQFDRVGLALQISNTSNSSNSITFSQWIGFYTKNVSTLSLLMSTSISTNFTGSGTVGSYSLYAGPAWQTIPWTSTLPEGDYYAGIILRSTTGGGAGHSISQLLLSKFTNTGWSGIIGVASATSVQRLLGQGHYATTTSSLPATVHFNQIVGSGSLALRSPIWMLRSGTV